jgi:allophanate hydrolase
MNENAKPHCLRLAMVGAHLSGMPLNHQLLARQAVFVKRTATARKYRLYELRNATPRKPGLVRTENGASIEVELWDMPLEAVGSFLAEIPPPLGLGTLELFDGRNVHGFICEGYAIENAIDITGYGGWRNYCNAFSHVQ